MNPYYTQNFTGQAGQTARAEQVASELQAIESAFDQLDALVERSVRAPIGETLTELPDAANRALKYLFFDASGDPNVVTAPFNWRGTWLTATAYVIGDVVKAGTYSSLYICTVTHTSGGSFDDTKFAVMVDLTGLNVIRNEYKTASFNAVSGGDYMVNSAGGDIEITLPAAPTILDSPINITHVGGTLTGAQLITVLRNGKPIMSLAENLSINQVNASISLMFCDDTRGWRLRVLA